MIDPEKVYRSTTPTSRALHERGRRAASISAWPDSQRRLEPSMSVKRKVTTPHGSTAIARRDYPTAEARVPSPAQKRGEWARTSSCNMSASSGDTWASVGLER